MKKILTLIVLCVLVSSINASANEGSKYFGINLSRGEYSEDGISEDFNPLAIIGKFGYCVHKNFAIEGRLGIGLTDDEKEVYGYDVSLELDSLIGFYGKGILDLNERIQAYGLIGLTRAEGTVEASGYSESDDDTGLSYGIGIDFELSNKIYVGLEYVSYLSKSDFDLAAFSVGITKYF
jgi:opacity protein-like surface antigen